MTAHTWSALDTQTLVSRQSRLCNVEAIQQSRRAGFSKTRQPSKFIEPLSVLHLKRDLIKSQMKYENCIRRILVVLRLSVFFFFARNNRAISQVYIMYAFNISRRRKFPFFWLIPADVRVNNKRKEETNTESRYKSGHEQWISRSPAFLSSIT